MTSEEQIRQILSGLTPQKKPGLLQSILSAIPQALSVAFSNDPAQALGGQLAQQGQARQLEEQRQFEINKLAANLQIEDILAKAREKRAEEANVRAEQRQEEFAIRKEARDQQTFINRFNLELTGQEKIENLKSDLNFKLAKFNADENEKLTKINQNFQIDLENLRNSNETSQKKFGAILGTALPIVMGGYMEPEKAYDLFSKITTTGKVDPKDVQALNKAIKAKEASERAFEIRKVVSAASASRPRDPEENAYKMAFQAAKTERLMYIKDPKTGERKLTEYVTGGVTNDPIVPPGFVFDGLANYQERLQHFQSMVAPIASGFRGQTQQKIEGSPEKVKSALLDQFLQTPGLSNAEKMQALSDPGFQQQYGIDQNMINQALQRNKVTVEQAKPVGPDLRPESERVKETPLSKIIPRLKKGYEEQKKKEAERIPQF